MKKEYGEDDCWRKAAQEWEMAGLARQDQDYKDADAHTKKAREWESKARRIARGLE